MARFAPRKTRFAPGASGDLFGGDIVQENRSLLIGNLFMSRRFESAFNCQSWFKAIFSPQLYDLGHTPKNPLVFVPVAVASIMAGCGRPKTALGEFAKCLQQEKAPDLSMKFPMYVVSLQNVLKMTEVRCHQQLLEDGIMTTMGDRGKAMFLSHQWVSQQHPDPDGKQLKVFQDAMKNLLDGSAVPNYSAWAEIMSVYLGRPRFATSDLSETSLFVWYDYFSIPQYTVNSRSVSTNLYADQRNGILSISAYIHRCEFFVVLCPSMKHATLPAELSYHSWAERGWCRLEAMARELSVKNLSWETGEKKGPGLDCKHIDIAFPGWDIYWIPVLQLILT